MLEREFKFYQENRDQLIKSAKKRFIVIVGESVVGEYDSAAEAARETVKKHLLGTFLIQDVSPLGQETVVRFHSRASL